MDEDATPSPSNTECGSPTIAPYHLVGVVCHKGTSVHCGHYVTYVHEEDRWVLFNDEKVVEVPKPELDQGYLYVYARK